MLQRAQAKTITSAAVVRRPAVPVAVGFLLGVVVHPIVPVGPTVLIVAVAGLAVLAVVLRRSDWIASTLLWVAVIAGGAATGQLDRFFYPPTEIALFTSTERQLAQLELTLEDPPRVIGGGTAYGRPREPQQFARARVRRVLTGGGWVAATGSMLLHVEPPDERLAGGETIRTTGWLSRLAPAMNPGQYDFAEHYRNERTLASFSVQHAGNISVVAPAPRFAPLATIRAKSRELLAAGFGESWATDHALLRALLLGDNDPLLRDIHDLFVKTGTSHHLSISGLHVAVLTGFVYLLCHLCLLSPRTTAVVTLSFAVLYSAAALPNPPVVRSVLLCGFVIAGALMRRGADLVQLLALSVFVMLVYAPLDLYDVGFQLSFGTVLGLMLFTRPVEGALFPVDVDVALAPKRKRGVVADWWGSRLLEFRTALVAAVVAWFVSLPMILHHFDRLNPWAVVASVVLAPVVFVALIGGLLKIVFTLVCPPLAGVWATLAYGPIWLMRHGVEWLAMLPGSDYTLRPPPVWVMVAYYAALMVGVWPKVPQGWRRRVVVAAAVGILAVPLGMTVLGGRHPHETRVTVLSVGAGSCAVVETDAGETMLIDAGSSGSTQLYRNVLEPFLRSRGIRHVDAAYVSHADSDHFAAIPDLARDRGVGTTFVTPYFRRDAGDSPAAANLLQSVPRVEDLTGPREIRVSDDTTLSVLWPPPEGELSSNDSSMVLKLTVAGRSVLFPGDIQAPAMEALLAEPAALKSDVLVAAHHGSFEPTTPDFVAAVGPGTIISSDDATPSGKQRTFDDTFPGVIHTHEHGAVTIVIGSNGTLTVTPFRP